MRHRIKGKKLSRNSSQRKALFKSLINALVIHGEIKTTENKAKAIRSLVDKLINKGKRGTFQARRLIGAFLQNKTAVDKIVDELSPIYKNRAGGFTKIIRLKRRRGDDAMIVKLELVEKPSDIKPSKDKKTSEKNSQKREENKKKK